MKKQKPYRFDKNRPHDKTRRSHRSEQKTADGVFLVDSLAAVKEFCRFRPQCIKSVRAHTRVRSHYEKELAEFFSLTKLSVQVAAEDEPPFSAEVMLAPQDLDSFLAEKSARQRHLVIAVDHVEDPRNMGAIVRSAAFFGVDTVIAPQDRQALLTPASVSTSMGGFALVDLVVVTNLVQSLRKLKEAGYWVVAADMAGKELSSVRSMHEKVVLVLGAEEKGLSRLVREEADHLVAIRGGVPAIESLNVSVAAAILMERFSEDYRVVTSSQT